MQANVANGAILQMAEAATLGMPFEVRVHTSHCCPLVWQPCGAAARTTLERSNTGVVERRRRDTSSRASQTARVCRVAGLEDPYGPHEKRDDCGGLQERLREGRGEVRPTHDGQRIVLAKSCYDRPSLRSEMSFGVNTHFAASCVPASVRRAFYAGTSAKMVECATKGAILLVAKVPRPDWSTPRLR